MSLSAQQQATALWHVAPLHLWSTGVGLVSCCPMRCAACLPGQAHAAALVLALVNAPKMLQPSQQLPLLLSLPLLAPLWSTPLPMRARWARYSWIQLAAWLAGQVLLLPLASPLPCSLLARLMQDH